MGTIQGLLARDLLATWGTLLAAILGVAFLRFSALTPLTILLALEHGLSAPTLLALRAAGGLILALALALTWSRWGLALRRRLPRGGRLGRLLTRGRRGLAAGHPFGTFLGLGVLINSYVVLILAPTLRAGRAGAIAGAILGESLYFGLTLGALLGLTAALDLPPLALTLALSVVALVLGAGASLLPRRRTPATT